MIVANVGSGLLAEGKQYTMFSYVPATRKVAVIRAKEIQAAH